MITIFRHLPRFGLLLVLQSLARRGWNEEYVYCNWWHSAGLLDLHRADVYLWQEGANVDGEEELDGKVLRLLRVK